MLMRASWFPEMRRLSFSLLCLLPLLLVNEGAAAARTDNSAAVDARLDALYGSHQAYRDFLAALKYNVAHGDKARVAAMVAYPLTVRINGVKQRVKSPQRFLANYRSIMTPAIENAIRDQQYENLFARDSGIMIGKQGEVWFSGICEKADCKAVRIKIIAINN